jgi:hypothetical protein
MGPTGFKLLFLGLMGSGVPVALAMAGASLIYVMASGVAPDFVVIHRMVSGIDSFPLLAVPFFVLAGNLMNSRCLWSGGSRAGWGTSTWSARWSSPACRARRSPMPPAWARSRSRR